MENKYDEKQFEHISEGLVKTVVEKVNDKKNTAFYNPAQVINRDLSVLMVQSYINQKKDQPEQQVFNCFVFSFFPLLNP